VTARAIETEGLRKEFGQAVAVEGIDLTVPEGAIHGFLGPNGAGKTTTIRMLTTLIRPTSGRASIFGHDLVRDAGAVRACMSVTGQYASLDNGLTGVDNLVLVGRLQGHPRKAARGRAVELLEAFGLAEAADREVKHYSGGMRRRLDIAASIVVKPRLLVLDEPTTGLDLHSRERVWEAVRGLATLGTTVLLTTQYLEEADQLADRLVVIDRGRVIADGTPAELKAATGTGTLHVRLADARDDKRARLLLAGVLAAPLRPSGDPVVLVVGPIEPSSALGALSELDRAGISVAGFEVGQPSLDEVFLALTDSASEPATTLEVVR
jgi:ABC-2 type transport system ATP-binding protein